MKAKQVLTLLVIILMLLLSACSSGKDAQSEDINISKYVDLPTGATELSENDLQQIVAWFNEDYIRGRFLQSTYSDSKDIDLYSLFFYGCGNEYESKEIEIADMQAFLTQYGWWGHLEPTCVTSENIDTILQKYANSTLSETNKINLSGLYSIDETYYYSFHGSIIDTKFEPAFGYKLDDTICIYYKNSIFVQTRMTGYYRVTIKENAGDYTFVSNEFCDLKDNSINYKVELPVETSGDEVFSYDETIAKIKLYAADDLNGTSLEGAVQNVLDQPSFKNFTLSDQVLSGISAYGTIIAGALDDEAALYYITTSGDVYQLPLFVEDVEIEDVIFSSNEFTFEYTIEVSSLEEDETLTVVDYYGTILLPTNELYTRIIQSDFVGN